MSGEWNPGHVAIVMRNGREVVAMRYDTGAESGWRYQAAVGVAFDHFSPDPGTKPRPLVVIDPDDDEHVERLTLALEGNAFRSEVQAALRSLVTPPKPEEPRGIGAVVEDADGAQWVLVDRRNGVAGWRHVDSTLVRPWAFYESIAVAKVLSEGVPS